MPRGSALQSPLKNVSLGINMPNRVTTLTEQSTNFVELVRWRPCEAPRDSCSYTHVERAESSEQSTGRIKMSSQVAECPAWLPAVDGCRRLGISRERLRRRIESGKIVGELRFGRWFVLATSIDEYKASEFRANQAA